MSDTLDSKNFSVVEATIAEIHSAYLDGRTTARAVTQAFLDRIEAYDKKGPALAAIVVINPEALAAADELDAGLKTTGALTGPLHGIPVLVKDNYDMAGLQTTGGSSALIGWAPSRDASIIARLRAAGAILLAKTTMSEWARGGFDNINSVLPGFARNPYNTAYATGGSSGGTGAGLAANFGVVGLGSDTFGSIRNPSSNNALVGLRPTWALASRAGMVGLYDGRDTAGPMARSVTDLAKLLDVIAGVDAADPATSGAAGHIAPTYTAALKIEGARGKRIGVLRQAFPPSASDPEVLALLDKAVRDLRQLGAEIIDPFEIPEFDKYPPQSHPLSEVRAAIERYLATTGPEFPKTVAEVVASGKFHPLHETGLIATAKAPPPSEDPVVAKLEADETDMRIAYLKAMDAMQIDAFILPVASYAPKLNGDRNTTPAGANTWIASGLHWPAIAVPMGYSHENLPSGLQIVGRPWSELTLLEIAFAYEQATLHRYPPPSVPPLDTAASSDDEVNLPAVVAEVTQAFERYNAALGRGDVEALNTFFWESSHTIRFGMGESLFGFEAIRAFRTGQWRGGGSVRTLERLAVTTLGRNFATTNALFRRPGDAAVMRQSQTWARRPEGWRIISAHLSQL